MKTFCKFDKIVALFLGFILVLNTSCEKFLSEVPKSQYSSENFFIDESTLNAGVVGIYSSAKDLFGVYTNTPLFMTLLGTDEAMFKSTAGIRFNFDRYTFSVNEGAIKEFWIRHYEIIVRANGIMDVASKLTTVTEEVRSRVIAEARFVRALMNFRLVQTFGELPLIDYPILGDITYDTPRSPIADVYNLIVDDLQFASSTLPPAKTNNGHANQWAAKTLLGKVYLTMASAKETAETKETGKVDGYKTITLSTAELYRLAWDVLKDVKDKSGASLLPIYGDVFEIKNKNVNAESIFELQFGPIPPYGSGWSKEFGMTGGGNIDGNPAYHTNSLVGVCQLVYVPRFQRYYKENLTDPDYDIRRVWNLSDSAVSVVNNKPANLVYIWGELSPDSYNANVLNRAGITKYRWGKSWRDASEYYYTSCPNNIIILRYADVLLMFAEADYKKNGSISPEGLEAINRVRQRARGLKENGEPVTEAETPGFKNYTAPDIDIIEILKERSRELCFEFQRWFDLARTGQFEYFLKLTRDPAEPDLFNTATQFDPSKHYLFPIPQSEIELSTDKDHFRQNPNY